MRADPLLVVENRSLADEEVVVRVLGGETALFEILMRRHNQRLFRAVRAIARSDADAEDVVQQAWISAYTKLGQFAGSAQLSTWLTRIAINEALGRTRQHRRLAEVELEEQDDMASEQRSPEEQALGREQAALLEQAIDGLPDAYRLVFVMREVQQLSVAETAACLELSEENVKVRLHRARGMLREALYARVERAAPEVFRFDGARCDRIVAAVMGRIGALPLPGSKGAT